MEIQDCVTRKLSFLAPKLHQKSAFHGGIETTPDKFTLSYRKPPAISCCFQQHAIDG